ncbi:hypothetical protein CYY_007887 [Polysphondylium violaceum]|uniref:Uncharacterized protein n=1 Tax=Polysphondylium violaceum TaxID=133409 RepID=A0A8J4PWH8_9MYCE|nr:hypothetical protein CYY_007887 [Polysphondylium violaceum]
MEPQNQNNGAWPPKYLDPTHPQVLNILHTYPTAYNTVTFLGPPPPTASNDEIVTWTPVLNFVLNKAAIQNILRDYFHCRFPQCGKVVHKIYVSSHVQSHNYEIPNLQIEEQNLRIGHGRPKSSGIAYFVERYSQYILRMDENGNYRCFYNNCDARMHSNFARHLLGHEINNEGIDLDILFPSYPD